MAKIDVVDEGRDSLEFPEAFFRSEGHVVRIFLSGEGASDAWRAAWPDLIFLGAKGFRASWTDLLDQIRREGETPVILLAKRNADEVDEVSAFRLGAGDFVREPFSGQVLLERALALLRRFWNGGGRKDASPDTRFSRFLRRGTLRMDTEKHLCTWKGVSVVLTVTEFMILHALAQRPGVVKSRNALMDVAHGDRVYVDDRTVDSHVKRLRRKFKAVDDRFDAIETLYGVGYKFKDTEMLS